MKTRKASIVVSFVAGLGVAACQAKLHTGKEGPSDAGQGGSTGAAGTGGFGKGGTTGGGGSVDAGDAGAMCNGLPLPANPSQYPVCAPEATMVFCHTCEGLRNPECAGVCFYDYCWECGSGGWGLSSLDCVISMMGCSPPDSGHVGDGGIGGSPDGGVGTGGIIASGGRAGSPDGSFGVGGVPTGGVGAGGNIGGGGAGGVPTGGIGVGGITGSGGAGGSADAGGSSPSTDAPPAEVWKVTIDVNSGLPNPVFTLEPSEVVEVQARLDRAPLVRPMDSANETIIPARLGYRGMHVKASAGDTVIEDTEISEGTILRRTTGAVYDGKSVNLEGYLLSLSVAKGVIDQGLADAIGSDSHGSIP